MANRVELLQNAVDFLADSKTQESPLVQRIQFLESKGLTQPEIDIVLREASVRRNATSPSEASYAPGFTNYSSSTYGFNQPAPIPQRDWRDYFIIAVVSGGLMYGAMAVARKYLFPHLQPPTQTQYEHDSSLLAAQFDAIEEQLKVLQADCDATRQASEAQRERVAAVVGEIESTVQEMKESDGRYKDQLREIREEVDVIRDMVPKMLEKNKEGSNASLLELQQELKSLRTLLVNSTTRPLGSGGPTLPAGSVRPTIPAWQLSTPAASSSTPMAKLDAIEGEGS